MARRTRKSGLGSSMRAHANDETQYGMAFIDLPPGISGGIAKLVEAKTGEYKTGDNKGKSFIYLAGVVLEPETVEGVVRKVFKDGSVVIVSTEDVDVKGQRTSAMLPLCETARSEDENIENALNELRKLGGEECTEGLGGDTEKEAMESLDALLEELKEQGPFFKFGTSASTPTAEYPEPRTWENWFGVRGLEDYEPEEESDPEVEDDPEDDAEEDKPEKSDEDDIPFKQLGEAADEGDEEAETELTTIAEGQDLNPDDYETWSELAVALGDDVADDTEEEDDDDPGTETPEKGVVYGYKPPKSRTVLECECTAVFEGRETCNLKDLDGEKIFKSVSWDDLEEVS